MNSTKITFNYGAMNSGKSLELLKVAFNYIEQGHIPLILKSEIDTRMPGFVYSRTGLKREAFDLSNDPKKVIDVLKTNYDNNVAILVEESNFLSAEAVDTIVKFAYKNNVNAVMFFGMKVDFRGNLFEGSKRIIEVADEINESTSVCWCGKKARQNGRVIDGKLVKDGPTILIEDGKTKVEYVTLCNYHYAIEQVK